MPGALVFTPIISVVVLVLWLVYIAMRQKRRRELKAIADVARLPKYRGMYRELEIVGESHRQSTLERLWDDLGRRTWDAILIPEKGNPYDPNAVRVEILGLRVAYLSRETAKEYRDYMGKHRSTVPVHLVKGRPGGTIGVFTGKGPDDRERGDESAAGRTKERVRQPLRSAQGNSQSAAGAARDAA
jgi:hypothetical protein